MSSLILPPNFIDLEQVSPGISLDIRYATNNNLVGRPINGYSAQKAFLLEPVALSLAKVRERAKALELDLLIYESFRPLRATQDFVEWSQNEDARLKEAYYPTIKKSDLFKEGYISLTSTHTRGIAVDLTLTKSTPQGPAPLDMGTPFDFMDPRSATQCPFMTAEQRSNRLLLCELMQAENFENYPVEWWHFTYTVHTPYAIYYDFEII